MVFVQVGIKLGITFRIDFRKIALVKLHDMFHVDEYNHQQLNLNSTPALFHEKFVLHCTSSHRRVKLRY